MQVPSPICSLCKSDLRIITDPETGEIICKKCGMIVSDNTQDITRSEWHATTTRNIAAFNTPQIHDRYSRTGNNPTSLSSYDMGLYTIIGKTNKDGAGHRLDASLYSTIKRLRTWDLGTQRHTVTAINLMQAFYELDILKDKLALPDAVVEKTAISIMNEVSKKNEILLLSVGKNPMELAASILYLSCLKTGEKIRLNDIAQAAGVTEVTLRNRFKDLKSKIELSN
jgi:transcription initiation factor TFIIB